MTTPAVGYAAKSKRSDLKPLTFVRRDLGPKDVAIAIAYCGVCHSDVHQARDEWGNTVWPCLPGHEIVGRVTAVGAEAVKHQPGDLVDGDLQRPDEAKRDEHVRRLLGSRGRDRGLRAARAGVAGRRRQRRTRLSRAAALLCQYCQLASLASLASLALVVPEAVAAARRVLGRSTAPGSPTIA